MGVGHERASAWCGVKTEIHQCLATCEEVACDVNSTLTCALEARAGVRTPGTQDLLKEYQQTNPLGPTASIPEDPAGAPRPASLLTEASRQGCYNGLAKCTKACSLQLHTVTDVAMDLQGIATPATQYPCSDLEHVQSHRKVWTSRHTPEPQGVDQALLYLEGPWQRQ